MTKWIIAILIGVALSGTYLALRSKSRSEHVISIPSQRETTPVYSARDSADDVAIFSSSEKSWIIGSDKRHGLEVYDMDGHRRFALAEACNNVDLRQDVQFEDRVIHLLAGSRSKQSLVALYEFDAHTGKIKALVEVKVGLVSYGLCLYRDVAEGTMYFFVNSRDGEVEQYHLSGSSTAIVAKRVRAFKLGSKVEGCVADDELGVLYVAEEENALWRYSAKASGGEAREQVDTVKKGGRLVADIEGLAIAKTGPKSGYLIVSSQGSDEFLFYDRQAKNTYIATISIAASEDGKVDAVSGTDGLEISTADCGSGFAGGVLVVQDDKNDRGEHQNFKMVSWESIAKRLKLLQ